MPALIFFLSLCAGIPAFAASGQALSWDDLLPKGKGYVDPLETLTTDQFLTFNNVLFIRDQLKSGEKLDEKTMENYQLGIEKLESEGIDVDTIDAAMNKLAGLRSDKTLLTNPELDGKQVNIPGYMLPLEFDGFDVSEFLLVPYVGACIHTPPPTANQIVHVKSAKGFKFRGGLFSPVRVHGLIKIKGGASKTQLRDGASLIYSSYAIEADSVDNF